MAKFLYRALNTDGQVVTGSMETGDERSASRLLRNQGLTVVGIEPDTRIAPSKSRGKPSPTDRLLVIEQLAILLKAGVPLDEALASLAETVENPFLQQGLKEILSGIRQGQGFYASLKLADLGLPVYLIHLAQAGEVTGQLARALQEGAAQMAYENRIATELRTALIYPSILIVSGLAAVLLIFILVVPRFSNMLNRSGGDIPWLASAVLETGLFFNQNMDLILGFGVLLAFASISIWRNQGARQRVWDGLTELPLIGPWLLETDTGRWAAMLSTLLSSRVELTQALDLAQRGVQSSRLGANLAQVTKTVRAGSSLSNALQTSQAITSTGLGLVRVGEKSGELPAMLRALANMYTEYGRERMKRFLSLLEPIAILVIGGMIGIIMTGIILAITSVNDISI